MVQGLKNQHKPVWALISFPIMLAVVFLDTYPFSDTLSISMLAPAQVSNIERAAAAINGTVLKPGDEFSFNQVVGPRTEKRGYRQAPSYLGSENLRTVGGGICLVSSGLYQLALESGLQVDQRVPHGRTIKTVPPGLDATVWYGQADLRFRNTLGIPVQLTSDWNGTTLKVSVLGKKPRQYHVVHLERIVKSASPTEMVVELIRQQGSHYALVSRDHYDLSH
jgi:vancomycin resistance protein YoaR